MVEHVSIADPFIHEPKGVSSASANQVYVSDGSGSGSWKTVSGDAVTGVLNDVSSASSVYIPVTQTGTVAFVAVTLQASISTADSTLTIYDTSGNSMGTITIAHTDSAAGVTFSLTPITNTTVLAGGSIRVASDGGSSNTAPLLIAILVRPT